MSRRGTILSFAACVILALPFAHAQKSTERFIPIGKSPGLSGKHTVMGKILSVNIQEKSIRMADSAGTPYTVMITEKTNLWSDRSALKSSNRNIALKDCQSEMWAEVKYMNNERKEKGIAEWIKVRNESDEMNK